MHLETIASPLPELAPGDRALLLRYFALQGDLAALAKEQLDSSPHSPLPTAHCPLSLLDLLAWTTLPEIATWIAFHQAHCDHLVKQLALDALQTVAETSKDLAERRRAATTILRALNARPPSPRRDSGGSTSPRLTPPRAEPPHPTPNTPPTSSKSPTRISQESRSATPQPYSTIQHPAATNSQAPSPAGRAPRVHDQVRAPVHRERPSPHPGRILHVLDAEAGRRHPAEQRRSRDAPIPRELQHPTHAHEHARRGPRL